MRWDIYGQPLRQGHCEVHPHVPGPWPCSQCESERQGLFEPQPEPCWGCWEITGQMQVCDGTCDGLTAETIPERRAEWIKAHPEPPL